MFAYFTLFNNTAAVSCSPDVYRLGGVGFGSGTTGKLGRAWHRCMVIYVDGCGLALVGG